MGFIINLTTSEWNARLEVFIRPYMRCPWLASKTVTQFQLIGFSPSGAASTACGCGRRIFGSGQSKDAETFRANYYREAFGHITVEVAGAFSFN
jgi:hypothetical protein